MDIEAIVKKHVEQWDESREQPSSLVRAALTELAAGMVSKDDFEAALQSLEYTGNQRNQIRDELEAAQERIRQLEAERVPDESGRLLAGVAKVIAEYNKPWKTDKSGGCVGCGEWNPYGHPEQHGHAYDCPEENAWLYRQDWRARLNELLAAVPQQKKERE